MAVPNNGPLIAGVTWVLCGISGGFLALRLYAKLSRRQQLWWDDHILILAWALLFVETTLTQVGVRLGVGKHIADIPPHHLGTIALGMSVGASISSFASTFSKISFGLTLLRLTSSYTRAFVWFCIITLFLVMLPSAVLVWVNCKPMAKAWISSIEGKCLEGDALVIYGIFNAAWCTCADFALALLPWKLIWGLSLHWKEKLGIGIAMSMGILAGMCAIIKGIYLMELAQQDFLYNGKNVTIWTAVETATAIIGASIPVLRVFFKQTIDSYYSGHSNSHSHNTDTAPFGSTGTMPLGGYPNQAHQNRQRRSMDKWGLSYDNESLASEDDSDDDVEYAVDDNGMVYTIAGTRDGPRRISNTSTDDGDQILTNYDRRTSLPDRVSFQQRTSMNNGPNRSVDQNKKFFSNNNRSSNHQAPAEEIEIIISKNAMVPPPPPSPPPRKLTPRPLSGPHPPAQLGTGIWTTRTASAEYERNEKTEVGLAI